MPQSTQNGSISKVIGSPEHSNGQESVQYGWFDPEWDLRGPSYHNSYMSHLPQPTPGDILKGIAESLSYNSNQLSLMADNLNLVSL